MIRCLAWLLLVALCHRAAAWDYEGHRIVNQLAFGALPADFPAFARTPEARERLAYLSGEPDRWRNSANAAFHHSADPEHFFDVDDLPLAGLKPEALSAFRQEFTAQWMQGKARRAGASAFSANSSDPNHTRELTGFLPWAINDGYAKVESGFAALRELEGAGEREDVAQARQNVLYSMGILGHWIGDAAQPLHTTHHFNGWLGPNPERYRTNHSIHSWIDGGFIRAMGISERELRSRMRPAKLLWAQSPTNIFPDALKFILAQHAQVETLYRMDRDGALTPRDARSDKGREFIAAQLVLGAQWLSDLWYTAWKTAPPDTFLRRDLTRRRNRGAGG